MEFNTTVQGHVLEVLRGISDEVFHCTVTSMPYFGLRDYGIEPIAWGGDAECRHEWDSGDQTCRLCGACLSSLGLEQEMDCGAWARGEEPCGRCYICHLREIFAEVRRTLRSDGTCWCVIADSYAGSGGGGGGNQKGNESGKVWFADRPTTTLHQLAPKQLCLVPFRFALAMQADGWWIRNDNIWEKKNPLPESVRDRCTKSHEYVFMLAKSKSYYYDQEAVREPHRMTSWSCQIDIAGNSFRSQGIDLSSMERPTPSPQRPYHPSGRNKRTVWDIPTRPADWDFCYNCRTLYEGSERRRVEKYREDGKVWRICPKCGSRDDWVDHFAAFPSDLVEVCIKAGTSEHGVCGKCGAQWERMIEITKSWQDDAPNHLAGQLYEFKPTVRTHSGPFSQNQTQTIGWRPTCSCDAAVVPPIIFDPFMGSGTTGLTALSLGRRFFGVDINEKYVLVSNARTGQFQRAHPGRQLELIR